MMTYCYLATARTLRLSDMREHRKNVHDANGD